MLNSLDPTTFYLLSAVVGILIVSSLIGYIFSKRVKSEAARATVTNLNARIRAWWIMCAIFFAFLLVGPIGTILLFSLTSFLALREYITLTPSKRSDHRALFWAFSIILPIQYLLIYFKWYGLFSIFIPVYAFLFIPMRIVIEGDYENFLERTAKIQWGLMICVFFISHVPALLTLNIPNFSANASLLFFFVMIVQLSDVFQYVCGKLFGKTKIAPNISPNKTLEGFIGGVVLATAVGTALWWATPFSPLQACGMALVINLMGFFGGLTMSAIKRDRGVKDFGKFIEGHGGMLDRIDSICFAAPVFFHLTRYYFAV